MSTLQNIIFSFLIIGLFTGCVSNGVAFLVSAVGIFTFSDSKNVEVTLLPEKDGKVGVISLVDNKGIKHTINKPYTRLKINKSGAIKDIKVNKQEIFSKYSKLLKSIPKKPKKYYFFFDSGSTILNEKQIKEIKDIAQKISSSTVHKVICIGNSDSTGTKKINERISRDRARAVANKLILNGIDKALISLKYYGDSNPLVKTNKSNAKNRRVEIVLK